MEPFAQGVAVDELAELADEAVVPAESEIGVDPVLECLEPQLVEAIDVGPRELLVGEVVERAALPERQGRSQAIGCRVGIAVVQQPPALTGQPLEALGVDLIRAYLQHVSGRQRDENLVLASVAAWLERLAKMRDVALEHVRGGLRRRVTPQVVDQSVGGDDLVRTQQEQREHSPLLRASEWERRPTGSDLQRAQDAEIELLRGSNVAP